MIRSVGAFLVTAATGTVGFALAAEEKKRLLATEGFFGLFSYILLRLPELGAMEDIIGDYRHPYFDQNGVSERLTSLSWGDTCNKRYSAAIECFAEDAPLYSVLKRVGTDLGCTHYSRQESCLQSAADELAELCNTRRAILAKNEKCYRWVGVLAGAALSLLML